MKFRPQIQGTWRRHRQTRMIQTTTLRGERRLAGGSLDVKSLSASNEEKQLRLGLGLVLRYQDTLRRQQPMSVEAVLMVEREPTDSTWLDLCERVGVLLLWPNHLNDVLGQGGDNRS